MGNFDPMPTDGIKLSPITGEQQAPTGLGTIASQDADNVNLTGGTLQGIGVVTGSYTSNVNEALLRSCRKASAGTITKGQAVYITGSTGSHLEVELADADTESTSSKTFGIAAESITNSTEGYVIVEGLLTGLSNLPLTSFADGDALWLSSTAGGWQNTPPANPAHGVYLGRVINASNGSNGAAFVRIQNGYELDELHDVTIASPLETHALFYEFLTQTWKNRRPLLSDIGQSGATTGQVAQWNGTAWVPATAGSSVMKPRWNSSTASGSTTLTIPLDNTIPQSSEGVELITLAAVTPSSASNTIAVELAVILSVSSTQTPIIALFLDSNTNATAASYHSINTGYANLVRACFLIPSWSGSKDIKIRIGAQSGTLYWNRSTTTDLMGGVSSTVLVATELAV